MTNNHNEFFSFSGRKIPELLDKLFKEQDTSKGLKILDLGVGEGAILDSLISKGYLQAAKVTGVDISKRLLDITERRVRKVIKLVRADVRHTGLKGNSFDVIYSVMVIEHLDKPEAILKEIRRLLKPGGVAFISTVIKKKWAVYYYRKNNKFVLDPTHLHEFESEGELINLVEKNKMRVVDYIVFPRSYSFIELGIKVLIRSGLVQASDRTREIIVNNLFIRQLGKRLKLRIPGFYEAQILITKK